MPNTDPRVSFSSASYAAASTASIVNGRIIGVTDQDALIYDLDDTRHIINGGGSVTVDSAMSTVSTNPVQNKIIAQALGEKASTASLSDGSVTKVGTSDVGSTTQPIYLSGGTPTAIVGPIPTNLGGTGESSVDTTPTSGSSKMVTSGGVYTALEGKQSTLSFDNTPTENSTNPVTSGGVYTALQNVSPTITIDSAMSTVSTNPVENRVIAQALDGKQSTLTFDTTPTENSTNVVTSGSIYTYVNNAIAANMTVDVSVSANPPTATPASPTTTIYIVLVPAGEETGNLYDEYLWVNSASAWEKLGTQDIDLSGYQETLIAGTNIAIASDGKTISASHPTVSTVSDTTDTASPALGGTVNVIDSVTRDSNGHVTTLNTKTVTLPTYTAGSNITITNGEIASSHPTVSTVSDTTDTSSPSAGGTVNVIDSVTRDSNGHVTSLNTKTVTLPNSAATLSTARSLTTDLASTVSASFDGSGDASIGVTGVLPVLNGGTGYNSVDTTPTANSGKMVTSGGVFTALGSKQDTLTAGDNISISSNTISASHPTIATSSNTSTAVSPDFGDSFTVIDQITTDSNGHVTSIRTKTVTIPAMYWVTPSAQVEE